MQEASEIRGAFEADLEACATMNSGANVWSVGSEWRFRSHIHMYIYILFLEHLYATECVVEAA